MSEHYDVLVRRSRIVDGTGKAAFVGDIGIKGERITAVGDVRGDGTRQIDGSGLVTCPGFVDSHSHADLTILQWPLAENLVMQGITTFVGGNCGSSLGPLKQLFPVEDFVAGWWPEIEPDTYGPPSYVPLGRYGEVLGQRLGFEVGWRAFGEFLSMVGESGISLNYVPLVGHNPIRVAVMGEDFKRKATRSEILRMRRQVEDAVRSGAFGLSMFGDYGPGEYAALEEMIELARTVRANDGLFVAHTRHIQSQMPSDDPEEYGYGIYHGPLEDVWVGRYRGYVEVMEIGRRAGVPVHISHLANAYIIPQPHPDYLEEAAAMATLELIDNAKEKGVDVSFDVLPFPSSIATAVPLINAFPRWLKLLGKERLVKNLRMAQFRAELIEADDSGRMKLGMVHTKADPYWMDCFRILRCRNKNLEGTTIGEIARDRNTDPLETIFDILLEDPDTLWVQFLDRRFHPAAISVFLRHPEARVGTDVGAFPGKPQPEWPVVPPPSAYGLYPYYLSTSVGKKVGVSLEEAVKKATSMPAQRFGLADRGVIRPGAYADVVMLDLARVRMKGDFLKPHLAPEGIEYVMVNGTLVYEGMAHTGARPGRVLRRERAAAIGERLTE